ASAGSGATEPGRAGDSGWNRSGLRHDGRVSARRPALRTRGTGGVVLRQRVPASLPGGPWRVYGMSDLAALVPSAPALLSQLDAVGYLADEGLATALFCAVRLPQPLLLEGEAGVGKTEAARALAQALDTSLIRLQCYEGIDATEALYEWNYARQLL